jgi:hypothetical protein
MALQEYIVTLHNREDLDAFYDDMETPGGDLYIPDRSIGLQLRRSISRNTHYMLYDEEVADLREDERVRGVVLASDIAALTQQDNGWSGAGDYERSSTIATNDLQWGIYRHIVRDNPLAGEWGRDGTTTATADFTVTSSGKNVDVLVFDGFCEKDHPELAVNPDGTGGSRVNQFNWFSLTNQLGFGTNGTYDYSHRVGDESGSNHGTSVGSVMAGNRLGWARDANIFNLRSYTGLAPNYNADGGFRLTHANSWDYIREWHATKAVNAETGRRNPLVVNCSFGPRALKADYVGSGLDIEAMSYRNSGTPNFNPGRVLTNNELTARGVAVYATTGNWYVQMNMDESETDSEYVAFQSDVEDAQADGIIVVCSTGNEFMLMVKPENVDHDNIAFIGQSGSLVGGIYSNQPGPSANGQVVPETISVGNMSFEKNDRKRLDSNSGDRIDIFAAGTGVQAAVRTGGPATDPRNGSFQINLTYGTSFSAPNVAGVIALLLESNPNITQTEVKQWLIDNASTDKMFDSGTVDMSDYLSIHGAPNRILYWKNQRPEAGTTFPKVNAKTRPTSGRTYPRPRIRAKG